jgi:hypothetical protein
MNWSPGKIAYVKALIWGAIFEDKIKEEQHLLEAMKHGHVDAYYDYIQMTAAVDTAAADSAAYSEGDYWYADTAAVDSAADIYYYEDDDEDYYYSYADTAEVDSSAYSYYEEDDDYSYADTAAVDSAADEYYEWEDLAYHFTKWWYEKGEADFKETLAKAKQGDVEAQYQAGYTYYEITLVEDIESSIYWLKKAAQQKHVEAANLLGKIYIEKRKDYAEAYKYIKIAADGGLPNGKLFLGVFHFIGLECKEDTDLAFRLWEEAAKSDKESQDFLKELQEISNGVLIQ